MREVDGDLLVVAGCEHAPQAVRIIQVADFSRGGARPRPLLIANLDSFLPVVALALSADGGRIATVGNDEELEVWGPAPDEAPCDESLPLAPRLDMSHLARMAGERGEDEIQYAKDGHTRLVW